MARLLQDEFKKSSELDAIHQDFHLGGKAANAPVDDDEEPSAKDGQESEDEERKDNEVPAWEFDYLLNMPLWSLTEEKVAKLK